MTEREKLIKKWAMQNCFGYPQQGIAKMEYYDWGFERLKNEIPDITEEEIKGFEYSGTYDEYELSPSEYGNEELQKIIKKPDMIHTVGKIKCVIVGKITQEEFMNKEKEKTSQQGMLMMKQFLIIKQMKMLKKHLKFCKKK